MVGVRISSGPATEITRVAPTTAATNATAPGIPKSATGVHAHHLPGLSSNSSSHIRHVKSHDLDSGLTPSITPGDSAVSPVLATPEYAKRTSSCAASPTLSLCGIKSSGSASSSVAATESDRRRPLGSAVAEGKFQQVQSAASAGNTLLVPTYGTLSVTGMTGGLAPLPESSRSNIDITDTSIVDAPLEVQTNGDQRPRKSKQFSLLSYLFCCTGGIPESKVLPNGQQLISSAPPPVVTVEPSAPVADSNHFSLPPKSRILNRNALAATQCRISEITAPSETERRGGIFVSLKRLLPRSWRSPRVPKKDDPSPRPPDQETRQNRDSSRLQLSRAAATSAAPPISGLSNTTRKNSMSSREASPPRASLDRRVDRRPSIGVGNHGHRRSSRGSLGNRDPTANVIASVAPGVTVTQNSGRSASTLLSHIYGNRSAGKVLLKPLDPVDYGKKCLVLDLDETLVHSSFKLIPQADFVVPVEIEQMVHNVYVVKRPGVDEFLRRMGDLFEIVVFTASLAKYADPVIDMLDKHKVVKHRLFRESCYNHKGNYVKDLSQLGRDLRSVIIIDNSPASYLFHPSNAVPISSWFNDLLDSELLELVPFLDDLTRVENVTVVLDQGNE